MIYYNYKQLNYIIPQYFKSLKFKTDVKELKKPFIINLKSENEEV